MSKATESTTVLLADDDADDRLLVRDALLESDVNNSLACVEDGEDLLDYLYQRGKYSPPALAPRPGLILLDLNMPRMDGREALRVIKSDPALRQIPVIVFTTSKAEEDIRCTYDLGVNSFVAKPGSFAALVEIMRSFGAYWLNVVELPSHSTINR